jgi:hypothetical protein
MTFSKERGLMKPQPRSGDHIQQRGNVWHYWRIIPPDCKRAYGKSVESRSLDTMNHTEAKRLAKMIDVEVDKRIREIRAATDPDAIAEQIAKRVRVAAAAHAFDPFRADPRINYHDIGAEIEDAPLSDEARAATTKLAQQKVDEVFTQTAMAAMLGREIASLLDDLPPKQIEQCRAGILSLISYQKEGQVPEGGSSRLRNGRTGSSGADSGFDGSGDDAIVTSDLHPVASMGSLGSRWPRKT